MKGRLDRILQIRALLEEAAQAEFAAATAELRRLENQAGEQRQRARGARAEAVQRLLTSEAEEPNWELGMADAELFGWKAGRLLGVAASRGPALEAARMRLLDRRRQRLQMEALIASAAHRESTRQARREQRQLDEWSQAQKSPGTKQRRRGLGSMRPL